MKATSLNFSDDKFQFSFAENTNGVKSAWHGLGQTFDCPMTIEEAMAASHTDFKVSKMPIIGVNADLLAKINSGEVIIDASTLHTLFIENASCNMREDNGDVLAITSDSYGVVQNEDAFRFINHICGLTEDAPTIDTMGVLTDGTTFASIKMKNIYKLGEDDGNVIDMYLVVKNSFNNKHALSVCTAFQRVVCENTMNAAFRNAVNKIAFRHTKNIHNRLTDYEDAARTLKFYEKYKEAFVTNMEKLKLIKLSDKETEKIICKVLMTDDNYKIYEKSGYNRNAEDLSTRTKNIIENALEVLECGVGQNISPRGTGLHLYNGITTLFANHTEYKETEKKFTSIFGGVAEDRQQKAFELITAIG